MDKEIKETVRRMNNLIEHQFDKEYHTECDLFKDIQCLLDYITNLQEENMKLISENETIKNIKYMVDETIYKSRIDKAIEYIKNHREAVDERNGEILYWLTDNFDEEDLLNILKGEK